MFGKNVDKNGKYSMNHFTQHAGSQGTCILFSISRRGTLPDEKAS